MSSQLLKDGDTLINWSALPDQSHVSSSFQTEGFATVSLESGYTQENPSYEEVTSSSAYESSFFSESSTLPELDHHRARTFCDKLGFAGLLILTARTTCPLGTPCLLVLF